MENIETKGILDVASEQMTTEQEAKLKALAEAKAIDASSSTVDPNQYLRFMRKTRPIVRDNKKVGRNDPCPCGAVDPATGKPKKYKNCCLASREYEGTHTV